MDIHITPKSIFKILLLFISFLLLANLAGIIFKFYLDHGRIYGLYALFNFDTEKNIPTLYSSVSLLFSSSLLLLISTYHKRQKEPYLLWLGLALIFLFLSIDEFATLHENLIGPVRETLNTSGALYFAWVIPYSALLVIFLAFYFRFLLNLPKKSMILFLLSGTIYISGAIGFELIGGLRAESHGLNNLVYSLITTAEELLEMLGIALFIYSLLVYITEQFNHFTVNISRD